MWPWVLAGETCGSCLASRVLAQIVRFGGKCLSGCRAAGTVGLAGLARQKCRGAAELPETSQGAGYGAVDATPDDRGHGTDGASHD